MTLMGEGIWKRPIFHIIMKKTNIRDDRSWANIEFIQRVS